jgi:hypothetical protein
MGDFVRQIEFTADRAARTGAGSAPRPAATREAFRGRGLACAAVACWARDQP